MIAVHFLWYILVNYRFLLPTEKIIQALATGMPYRFNLKGRNRLGKLPH